MSVDPAPGIDAGDSPKLERPKLNLLELNWELLKVCMEFQAQGFPANEPRFIEYHRRFQSNLTWLAGAADTSVLDKLELKPPIMEPPVAVDFMSMERIQQLYAELPSLFDTREVAQSVSS